MVWGATFAWYIKKLKSYKRFLCPINGLGRPLLWTSVEGFKSISPMDCLTTLRHQRSITSTLGFCSRLLLVNFQITTVFFNTCYMLHLLCFLFHSQLVTNFHFFSGLIRSFLQHMFIWLFISFTSGNKLSLSSPILEFSSFKQGPFSSLVTCLFVEWLRQILNGVPFTWSLNYFMCQW